MNIDFTNDIIQMKEQEVLHKPFPTPQGYALFEKTKEGKIVRMIFSNEEEIKTYLNNLGYDWGNENKYEFTNFDSEKRLLTVLPALKDVEVVAADPQWDADKAPKETVTKHESDRTMEDIPHIAVELREVDHPLHWDESNYDTKASGCKCENCSCDPCKCEENEAKKPGFLKKKDDKKNGKKDDKKDDKKNGKKGDEEEKDKNGKKLPPWLNKKGSKSKDYSKLWEKVNANLQKKYGFTKGDHVKNINPQCKHFESEGSVKKIKELPNDEGVTVGYTCSNAGKNWKEGDVLFKTPDQLKKVKGTHKRN